MCDSSQDLHVQVPTIPMAPTARTLGELRGSVIHLSSTLLLGGGRVLISSLGKQTTMVTTHRFFLQCFAHSLYFSVVLSVCCQFGKNIQVLSGSRGGLGGHFTRLSLHTIRRQEAMDSSFLALSRRDALTSTRLFSEICLCNNCPLTRHHTTLFNRGDRRRGTTRYSFI